LTEGKALKLTISVVVYRPDLDVLSRSLHTLHASVLAARETMPLEAELSVIDNSCDAAWPPRIEAVVDDAFPNTETTTARLVVSPENGGYGKANNLIIREAESDYHLVANPDIYADRNAIRNALAYLEQHPSTGLLVPDVRGEDDERHYLCKRNPTLFIMFLRGFGTPAMKRVFNGVLARFEMRDRDYDRVIEDVEFPTGCFMMFRTTCLRRIGGFDDAFFMYLEDADIGRRMRALADVRYVPDVKIVHRWARGTHNNWRLRWVTIQSSFTYWRKWGAVFKSG
jgi:hypothetical protein